MSKQDSHFVNIFGLVLGILIAVGIVIFGVSRAVGNSTQRQHVQQEDLYVEAVTARVAPPVRIAVAGADNSALEIVAPASESAGSGLAIPENGASLFAVACATCHDAGIGGAPAMDNHAAWGPRLAQGTAVLYKHAIEGFTGETGVMPPKGGRLDVSDELVRAAVDHMVDMAR